jgi:hypothetical protein
MNPKYSASRFSTYESCLLKYKLSYIDDLSVDRTFDIQEKGLVFHSIAEHTEPGESYESVMSRAKDVIAKSDFDKEKYPVEKAIPVFYFWWQKYIEEPLKNGYSLYKEHWENSDLDGAPLCGAVDALLINEKEKRAIIYDYKSGSSSHLDGYTGQLTLYAYMIAKRLGIKEEEIPDRIKCYLFYPLARIKEANLDTQEKIEKFTLKNMLQYKFSIQEYEDTLEKFKKIVEDTKSRDWEKVNEKDSTISYQCSFCGFCGHPKYCPNTFKSGLTFPHSAKVTKIERH